MRCCCGGGRLEPAWEGDPGGGGGGGGGGVGGGRRDGRRRRGDGGPSRRAGVSPAAAGLTLIAAAAADPIAAAAVAGVSVPPVRTVLAAEDDVPLAPDGEGGGDASVAGSPCSVASDCSSVASADFEGVGLGFFAAAEAAVPMVFEDAAASAATVEAEARVAAAGRSVFAVDCVPLWGYTSICGRRPEMEDAVATAPRFFNVPLWMLTGNAVIDGLDPMTFRLPAHFFGVYDGHGGAQVCSPFINDFL